RIVRLLMLTGQRRKEIGALQWSEVSDGAITLPAERTKNDLAHEVPLSAQAQDILASVHRIIGRDAVFGRTDGFSAWSIPKRELDEASGVKDWVLHDLRRTCATRMADLGVQPHIIEAVLNHISGHKRGVAGVYNRSTYSSEKRDALNRWAGHIRLILAKA